MKLRPQAEALSGSPQPNYTNFQNAPVIAKRDPNSSDTGYPFGQEWVNKTSQNVFFLAGVAGGIATWNSVTAGSGAVNTINSLAPVGGDIIIAGQGSEVSVSNAGHTVTLGLPNSIVAPGSLTTTSTLTVGTDLTVNGNATIVGSLTFDSMTVADNYTLGTNAGSVGILGNTSGATSVAIHVGTGNFALTGAATSTMTIGTGLTTGTVLIGGTAQTGNITLGSSSGTNNVLIGNGAGDTTVKIANGTAGANVVDICDAINVAAQAVNIGSGNCAADMTVDIIAGAPSAGNQVVNIFSGTATGGTQVANICTGASASTLNLGNVTSTSGTVMKVGSGNFSLDGVAGSTYAIGAATTTGTITIGGTAQSTGVITLGSSSATSTVKIQSGAGASTCTICEGTGAANTTSVNNGATAQNSTINLMAGAMTAGTHAVNILSGNSSGGTETLNACTGTGAYAINIGTGAIGVKTIDIGGTAANVITIGNTQTGGSLSLAHAMTTGNIVIGDSQTSGTFTLGSTAAGVGAVRIFDGTGAQTITMATGAGIKTLTIGSTNTSSATTINAGSGNLTLVGRVLKTTSPAFLGYLAATALNKTGNGASYTIGTDALTIIYDRGSNFTTAGVFTAPVTGIYDLRAQVTVTGATIATSFVITIVTTARSYINTFTRAAGATDQSISVSALADMTATDTAHITIVASGEAADTDDILGAASAQTYFCGALVA